MAYSSTIYTIEAGDVGKTVFDLTFEGATANPPGYLSQNHIFMFINDLQVTEGGGAAAYGASGITFTFTTSTSVTVSGYSGVLDDKVEFRRTIPKDKPVINFVDGAGITESLLDQQSLANLYSVHEIMDGFGTGVQNYYALAKLYANGAEDYEIESGQYSAYHYSVKASDSAAAALVSENAAEADAVSTAADAVATAADAVATAADRVQTGLDAAATAADAVDTAADAVSTAADRAQVTIDAATSAANAAAALVSEGNASDSEDAAAASAAAALVSEGNASDSEDAALASEQLAEKWAEEDEDTEVEAGAYSAKHWATKAAAAAESGLRELSVHTATAGQTAFTHTATVQNESVYLNGVLLKWSSDYTYSGTVITLAAGAAAGDLVTIETFGVITVADVVNASELPGYNYITNGDFRIWQRSRPITDTYTADRWLGFDGDGAISVDRGDFTPGQTDVPGNPEYYMEYEMTTEAASGSPGLFQRIENVHTLVGSTAILSFWAKVASGTKDLTPSIAQNFGSGGSASAQVLLEAADITVTTTWQKFEVVFAVPSISGKTLDGGDDHLRVGLGVPLSDGLFTLSIAQVKFEEGNVATPFVSRPLSVELAECMRFYQIIDRYTYTGLGVFRGASSGTILSGNPQEFPVPMRAVPTATTLSDTTANYTYIVGGADLSGALGGVVGLGLSVRSYKLQETIGCTNSGTYVGTTTGGGLTIAFDAEL